jgi:hypothetical protein
MTTTAPAFPIDDSKPFAWLEKDHFPPSPPSITSSNSDDDSDDDSEVDDGRANPDLWPHWPNASEDSCEESCPSLMSFPGLEKPDEIINLRKVLFWNRVVCDDPVQIRKQTRNTIKGRLQLTIR